MKLSKLFSILFVFTLSIGIQNNATAQCNASYTYQINTGGNVTFTNTSTGTVTSQLWDFDDGNTAWWYSGSHTFPYNGIFNVCLTVADTATSCFNTFCDSITITNNNATCITTGWATYNGILSYNFNSGTSGVQPFTYSWDFGDGNFSTQASPFHTYAQNGQYTVIIDVTDALGCLSSDTMNIDFTCTAGYTSINNGTGNFSFSSVMNQPGTTYFWDFGDGNNSTLANPQHTYANNGPFNVCLTVTNIALSCTATYCDSIISTGTGNINCNFSYGANWTIPNGPTFNFWTASGGTTFLWNFGDGNTSTQANPQHTYTNQGPYTYCVTVDNCPMVCGTLTAYNCNSNFYFYPDSLNIFDVIVVNNAVGNNLTYFWDFGDGNTSTSATPQHTYAANGTYYLCLTVNNGVGCIDNYCDSINGSGINKTGFTINVIQSSTTGINNLSKDPKTALSIYPNPTNDRISFMNSNNVYTVKEVGIYDINGQLIIQEFNVSQLYITSLSNGLYYVRTKDLGGKTQHFKLIKQ